MEFKSTETETETVLFIGKVMSSMIATGVSTSVGRTWRSESCLLCTVILFFMVSLPLFVLTHFLSDSDRGCEVVLATNQNRQQS